MLFTGFILSSALASVSWATPLAGPHVLHEKRGVLPHGWERRDVLDSRAILPMRIGLTQRNLDKGEQWLMEVSHPESKKFGQHWNAKQIAEAFAPSDETLTAVREWLTSSGISYDRISQSQSLNWLKFDATVEEVESLLKTKYHLYEHTESGQPHAACDEYSIPAGLTKHIDFIHPTIQFDRKVGSEGGYKRILSRDGSPDPNAVKGVGQPGSGSIPKLGQTFGDGILSIIGQLANCSSFIVPNCLRFLYRFPPGLTANPANSYGIVEYTPQAYVPSDLDKFFRNFSSRQVGNRPILKSIDGGVVQRNLRGFNFNGESDLDLEYAMTLIYPQNVTLFQTGDTVEGASFNNFLDAIDGSYCTYEGGDDPNFDGIYPDTEPGGYKGPQNCGGYTATKVISTSYSFNEHDAPPKYEQRQCNEYMKLGMMGISILYSSGDYGVAGNGGVCINGTGPDAPYQNGTLGGRFNPGFPATCPYITSVGATQVIPGTNVLNAAASGTEPEQACETVIYSGGGFSNVFPLPSYQAKAVGTFFSQHRPPYGANRYNNTGKTRGFPDISANGANYIVVVDGFFSLVYGTSASSPVLGSILTLINEARYAIGKKSIGFVNPVAYANPGVFNDITKGGNQGCNTKGFTATTGWDPVTGLGTPNFPKMLALWLGLP